MPNLTEVTFKKCDYAWMPRVPNPKACPDCKSRNWNK